jgi:methyl-accepting chemotaxis protein
MIKDQARIGTRLLVGLVAVAIALSAFVVSHIRYGGPMFRKYALQDELVADILPPPAYLVESYLEASLLLTAPEKVAEKTAALDQLHKDFDTRKAYWASAGLPADEAAILGDSQKSAALFWDALEQRYLPAIRKGDLAQAKKVHDEELGPAYAAQHGDILKLVDAGNAFKAREHKSDDVLVDAALALVGLLMAGLVAAVIYAGRFIRGGIVEPLAQTASAMEQMAAGDYQSGVDGLERSDEIGTMAQAMEVFRRAGIAKAEAEADQKMVVDALSEGLAKLAAQDLEFRLRDHFPESYESLRHDYNRAQDSLMSAMGAVRVGAASLSRTIHEIRAASEDLARRNEIQAASLEETAASLNEVSSTVEAAANTAETVRSTTQAAHAQASDGGEVVTRAIEAMAGIEHSSEEIGQIVNVIDGIAFQTNLLALNAGVEAARAGDAGKGFAVVASEVRLLAQRSADAARDIKDLIANSSAQVSNGVALVGETGEKLRDIVVRVGEISSLIDTMAENSQTQAVNLVQVNRAVGEMDRMTQQNAAMVEQSNAATRALAEEAIRLDEMVKSFRTRNRNVRPETPRNPGALRRQSALEIAVPSDEKAPVVAPAPAPVVARPVPVVSGNLAVSEEWSAF